MFNEKDALEKVINKLERTSSRVKDQIAYRTYHGVFNDMSNEIDWWTNGFWPGILWLAYRKTNHKNYANWADGVELKLDEALKEYYGLHHDVGFMWQLSAVANYKLTENETSAKRGYMAASILASRFNVPGSFIRAWNMPEATGWAIIDCMMNLSILYWASDYAKDPRFSHIAQAHAETVMKNFIYQDGSSKHICEFNPITGEYVKNYGGQGFSENSAWSRGAAWALYGFALSASYTKRADFMNTAKRVANFFLSHLPEDKVPFADFKAPEEINIHKDSSAAACAASGLLLLSELVDENEKEFYWNAGRKIIESLYNNYTDWDGDEALINKGCTAFHTEDGGETSLIYGDFFFLEGLMRLNGYEGLF